MPSKTAAPELRPWLFAVAVFTSASLVFLVQPLIGRLFLPVLGGSPAIWNTTLAFFQAALLVGYGYAHLLQRLGPVRRQLTVHLAVLALAALSLPLAPSSLLGPPWEGAPSIWLAVMLALTIGAPFAVLSATAPLLQAWYARFITPTEKGREVYALYAASNLGSLLALAAYPIVVEPLMGLTMQAMVWSLAYGGFGLLLLGLGLRIWRLPEKPRAVQAGDAAAPISWRDRASWVLLAAAPSSLLVGVTAHLTADVASAPFLWVIPLELYLLTFVIAFRGRAEGPGKILKMLQIVGVAAAVLLLADPNFPWVQQLAVHLAAFFVATLVCHQTLAARRPQPARLTEFFLLMSFGGVLGGSFNAFIAPNLFDRVWEYPAVLVLSCLAGRALGARRWSIGEIGLFLSALVWIAPLLVSDLVLPGILRTILALAPVTVALILQHRGLAVAALLGAVALAAEIQGFGRYEEHHRSFFGVTHLTRVTVPGMGQTRIMVHGTTLHGAQALDPEQRCRATAYYAPTTAIGTVFRIEQTAKPALRFGAVGLGTGTVATFVRANDEMRFFEIDPMIARISLNPDNFSFVGECAQGPVSLVLGDARLSLTREPAGAFDLLLIDAFSSDSVPTHLLTVEALREYMRVVAPDGVVLLHLSNRNLELTGPAAAAAQAIGAHALRGVHWIEAGVSSYVEAGGEVMVLAHDPAVLDRYRYRPEWPVPEPSRRPWTDDYTNVWGAMVARLRGG